MRHLTERNGVRPVRWDGIAALPCSRPSNWCMLTALSSITPVATQPAASRIALFS